MSAKQQKERENKQCLAKLRQMLKQKENQRCADCGCKHPSWTSTWTNENAAVFICLNCAGIHRDLSRVYTFVQSTSLDTWNTAKLDKFKSKGGGDNAAINAIYEAKLSKYTKPNEQSDRFTMEQFIKAKYIEKKWYSNKPKKVKRKNKEKPLLENKEKNEKKKNKDKKKYIEEKIPENNDVYKSPQPQTSVIVPDLLSVSEMEAIAPKVVTDDGAGDLFDNIFNTNTSSMNKATNNQNVSSSKQDIMGMFNNKNNNNGNSGYHGVFNPDFKQNDGLIQERRWSKTGNYEQGLIAKNNRTFANNAQQIETLWNNNNNNNNNIDLNWNAFDGMDNGQSMMDSKSKILQSYKQKPSDHFMSSIYGMPQYVNNNNNNQYRMQNNPLKNDQYKKNNYKPMNNNNVNFSTVSKANELFSEFKI